jgi:putative oxidoreductase
MMNVGVRQDVSMSVAATGGRARAWLAGFVALLERMPLAGLQLLFRAAIAGVFLRAGLQKAGSWESTVQLFRDEYMVPALPPASAAALAASVEIGCSVLLLLGLGTRLAALPLLGMILVIQLFVYPQAWPEHLTWGSILLVLAARGGGTIAVDRLCGLEPPPRH